MLLLVLFFPINLYFSFRTGIPSGLNIPGKAMSSGSSKALQVGAYNSRSLRNTAVECAGIIGLICYLLHNLLFTLDSRIIAFLGHSFSAFYHYNLQNLNHSDLSFTSCINIQNYIIFPEAF